MPTESKKSKFQTIYWLLTAVLLAATMAMLFVYTPVEKTMGPLQKIFYVHLPAAINTFVACLVSFVGGVGYLWKRQRIWDELSAAGAKIAVLMCTIVLVTGVIWARAAWGQWWVWWSPRLTFSLLLWLLYVVYLIVRPSIESPDRRATICAVYATAAFLNVPLVYFSVRLMPDIHPPQVNLTAEMKLSLAAWFVPVTLLTAGLIVEAFAHCRRRQQNNQPPADTPWPPATHTL